ncbi:[NiFe]-hydrogenase assembly chaperone HybE [Allomesorhizobium alhagi]|uniref:Rubredoxin n=1 Tax=Mesorhizobium alhagi CCNWXJ12-2 TaxID=1107882 RepID=H0HX71_9HYPH|nr:[NiFe]-hydrogenase assembly chaperone HybE [Mesorhizobium alhagi]EHK54668.1 rubredoxin [Mesorhizobium alhagi CCNWXJ12-2]
MDHSQTVAARLEFVFQRIERTAMTGIPILNPALCVSAVGVQQWQGEWLAVLVTPWFMDLVLLPAGDGQARPRMPTGTKEHVSFPAGQFEFIQAYDEELGGYRMCSLFSPMFEFADQESAEEAGRQVLAELFNREAEEDEDGDMARVWEGRLAEEVASALDGVETARTPESSQPAGLPRRSLFGLGDKEEAAA